MANLDMEPLNNIWVTDIRLKETNSEASRCRNIKFYRKKTQMFQINGDLDIYEFFTQKLRMLLDWTHSHTVLDSEF